MVTNDLFYVVWRNVLRHYVWGIQMVEALMRRYGFGRLRLRWRWHGDPIGEIENEYLTITLPQLMNPGPDLRHPGALTQYLNRLGFGLPE